MNMASLNVPRVGDATYQDFEDGTLSYGLDTQDNNGRGEDNEVSVQRLLWDLYDSTSDGRDAISRSDNSIWDAIKAGAGAPHILDSYWQDLLSGQSTQNRILMGEIASDHLIGPRLVSPTEGAIISPASNGLSWQPDVGCPSSYSGNQFDLVFYDANTLATLLTIPAIGATNYALSNAQIALLVGVTHDVLWGVMGYHTGAPATGPYLGETFAAIVNRPPVADAGPDQPNVECTSYTTTPVQLDGTGSSDPDGDTITYAWAATGVVFDDPTSATPTGGFPDGTTVVTLTVSDGIQEDMSTVSITVVDTTPPDITCPAPITVECSSHCGTADDDIQFDGWFDTASAVDVCDPNPVITDDHPDCFPLGITPVTFTATDGDGNSSECIVNVTVEDTTPPEITVVLDRDVLWPANHKMATITATVEVTDICDPNPTFVLTSITSNEPEDDNGDGSTDDDIQEADYGTPDVEFDLRAERQGTESGRKYTIIYTAMDSSGNTADDTVCVVVPHSQSGNAMAAMGFAPDGASIELGVQEFEIVLLSSETFDVSGLNPRQAFVGNLNGAMRPLRQRIQDVSGDNLNDLVLTYSAEEMRGFRSNSTRRDLIGLHYTIGEEHYLVTNIFGLGPPMTVITNEREGEADGLTGIVDGQSDNGSGDRNTGTAAEDTPGTFALAEAGPVRVEVFDVRGRLVTTIADRSLGAGRHNLQWNGKDANGRPVPSGIYFYRVLTSGQRHVQKIVIAR